MREEEGSFLRGHVHGQDFAMQEQSLHHENVQRSGKGVTSLVGLDTGIRRVEESVSGVERSNGLSQNCEGNGNWTLFLGANLGVWLLLDAEGVVGFDSEMTKTLTGGKPVKSFGRTGEGGLREFANGDA